MYSKGAARNALNDVLIRNIRAFYIVSYEIWISFCGKINDVLILYEFSLV